MMTARFERRELAKAFFWLDLVVVALFCVSLMMLVRDAYLAGFWQAHDPAAHATAFWGMLRSAALLVGSLAWIFFRHFRGEIQQLQNPWA